MIRRPDDPIFDYEQRRAAWHSRWAYDPKLPADIRLRHFEAMERAGIPRRGPVAKSICIPRASAAMNTIELVGEIEQSTAHAFRKALALCDPSRPLQVLIDSQGGSVFAGNSIHDDVASWPGKTIAKIVNAFSAAAHIAQAFSQRIITPSGYMMVHCPYYEEETTESENRLLAKLRATMAKAIARRSGNSLSAVEKMMTEETWLNADDAIRLRLADSIGG